MSEDGSRLLRTAEVAELFDLAPTTLEHWRLEGKGPRYIKLGDRDRGAVRYRAEDVAAYLDERVKGAAW
jgi:predicted DNA-binding transcriptional regulator AlpA